MAEISDFVVVDANNNGRWPEGMTFDSVNDAGRADEGILARWFKDINGSLVTAGTATAYTLTPNRTVPALYVGLHFKLQFNVDCGANPTLTLPTLAAVSLVREGNTGLNALDVRAGPIYDVVYNGTGFQVTNIPLAPISLRRPENDTTEREFESVQSGSGAGNKYSRRLLGDGANNVATIREYFGATLVKAILNSGGYTVYPGGLQSGAMVDFVEVATPGVPGAGVLRLYAKTGSGVLAYREGASGAEILLSKVPPTVQRFLSGSGTYTPTAGVTYIRGRMVAAGAGFSTGGGNTSFAGWTAIGGTAGTSGGAGGTGGVNGTGTLVARTAGQNGAPGFFQVVTGVTLSYGGAGGSTPLGAGGSAVAFGSGAQSPTGFGSGAGGPAGTTSSAANQGSGSGEYVEFYMTIAQIGASQAYAVGAAGTGTPNGSSGAILIEEFYS